MTYWLVSLINKCNKSCPYCIVRHYLDNPEKYPSLLNFEDLTYFLEARLEEGDLVEITGGEPTIVPWLENFIEWLTMKGTSIILRTNGLNLHEWRLKYKNMIVVLAKHDSSDEYIAEKEKFLLSWDRIVLGIDEKQKQSEGDSKPQFIVNDDTDLEPEFERIRFIDFDGRYRPFYCDSNGTLGTIWEPKELKYAFCKDCSAVVGAWNLYLRIGKEQERISKRMNF